MYFIWEDVINYLLVFCNNYRIIGKIMLEGQILGRIMNVLQKFFVKVFLRDIFFYFFILEFTFQNTVYFFKIIYIVFVGRVGFIDVVLIL